MIQTLKQSPSPALLWQGNDGFLIWDGQRLIATDLDLMLEERKWPPTVDVDELANELDVLMVTHEHGDHFNLPTVRRILQGGRCRFVIPESCRKSVAEVEGLAQRTVFCKPGDHVALPGFSADCIRALHGHIAGSVFIGASMLDCGYRFTFGGLRFYQPGDTVLLHEQLEMHGVDVLFVSPTEHNMGVENAVRLIRAIQPQKVVIQHHSTYHETKENAFWTHGYVQELMDALSPEERARCIVPDPHTVISLK